MASVTKDLSALGSTAEIIVNSRGALNGHGMKDGTFHYIAGTGTFVVEATLQDGPNAVWFTIPDIAGGAMSAIAAVGVRHFLIYGYSRVRVRNTVAGVGNSIALGVG